MDKYEPVWFESKNTTGEVGVPNGFFLGFETLKIDHHLWNVDIERGISTIEGFKG